MQAIRVHHFGGLDAFVGKPHKPGKIVLTVDAAQ